MDAVGGDFNVTRADIDVYDPAAFVGSTHVTPDERTRLEALLEAGGLADAYRVPAPRRRRLHVVGLPGRATSTRRWACASTTSSSPSG